MKSKFFSVAVFLIVITMVLTSCKSIGFWSGFKDVFNNFGSEIEPFDVELDEEGNPIFNTSSNTQNQKENPSSTSSNKNTNSSPSNDGSGSDAKNGRNTNTAPYYNVKDFGAKGDGSADDTNAIKKAIEKVYDFGGAVFIPAGRYRVTSEIKVPMGVRVEGIEAKTVKKWRDVEDHTGKTFAAEAAGIAYMNAENFSGTWIIVEHGAGNINNPSAFSLEGNAIIRSMGFVYPSQAPIKTEITKYPPAIIIKSVKTNAYIRDGMIIENINLLNPYIACATVIGDDLEDRFLTQEPKESVGRLRMHNITGGPLYRGIMVKGMLDTVDVNSIRFGYTSFENTYAKFRANNCADLHFGREDGTNLMDIFSFGAKYGIFAHTVFQNGSASLRGTRLTLIGQHPYNFEASGQCEIGSSAFTTINFNNYCSSNEFGVKIHQDPESIHQAHFLFNDVTFKNSVKDSGSKSTSLDIKTSKDSFVSFANCTVDDWKTDSGSSVISYTQSASGSARVSFYNTTFKGQSTGTLFTLSGPVSEGALQFNSCTIPSGVSKTNSLVWIR